MFDHGDDKECNSSSVPFTIKFHIKTYQPKYHKMMLLLIFILSSSTKLSFANEIEDREVLNVLYDATNGHQWDRGYETWRNPLTSICEWEGVSCDPEAFPEERVLSLSLYGYGLSGEIPMTKLLQLPNLRVLDLEDNDVTYPPNISTEDVEEEYKAGIQSKLRHIKLGDTYLTRVDSIFGAAENPEIPVSMPELLTLSLNGCVLEGELPIQIHAFNHTLETLDLSDNDFEGTIPNWLHSFHKLKKLSLSENVLEDEIPDWIADLRDLEVLELNNNNISGTLKPWMENMNNLVELDLGWNDLVGPLIPFKKLSKLKYLDLSRNGLTGPIPTMFLASVEVDQFYSLDLGENQLTGLVPAIPFKQFLPQTFYLYDNLFAGVEHALCESPAAGGFGCNGILCPPGTYSISGMTTNNDVCYSCAKANGWGETDCDDYDDEIDDDDGNDEINDEYEEGIDDDYNDDYNDDIDDDYNDGIDDDCDDDYNDEIGDGDYDDDIDNNHDVKGDDNNNKVGDTSVNLRGTMTLPSN